MTTATPTERFTQPRRKQHRYDLGATFRFGTLQKIRDANRLAGETWFSRGNNRFFRTGYSQKIFGGRFFITSEQSPHNPRRYTVREALEDGRIETVGEYGEWPTLRAAQARAQYLAQQGYTVQRDGYMQELVEA